MLRCYALLCSIFTVLVVATGVYAADTVTMKHKFVPGEVMRYKITEAIKDKSKGKAMLSANGHLSGIAKIEVVSIQPNGDAELSLSYESCKFEMMGMEKDVSPKDLSPMTFVMSADGVVRDIEKLMAGDAGKVTVEKKEGDETRSVSTDIYIPVIYLLCQSLPDKELKKGETWTSETLASGANDPVNAKAELLSTDGKVGKHSVATFKLEATDDTYVNLPEGPGAQSLKFKMKRKVDFAPREGHIAKCREEVDLRMRVTVPDEEEDKEAAKETLLADMNIVSEISLL